MGYAAGAAANMGWNNTMIGSEAPANADGTFNSIALGADARVTASNQARIREQLHHPRSADSPAGPISATALQENIKENVRGLDFILQLRPVTYNLDIALLNNSLGVTESKLGMMTYKQAAREKSSSCKAVSSHRKWKRLPKVWATTSAASTDPGMKKGSPRPSLCRVCCTPVKAMQEQQVSSLRYKKQVNELSSNN